MKKILLSAVALVAAMSVNAQVFQMNAETYGITSDGQPITEGFEWGAIGETKFSNPFATTHKAVDCKNNDYIKVKIDGNEILTAGGVQGQDNPKDADGGNPALTLKPAASGAVVQIDAKADGWMYIAAKLSSNKQYVAFEEGKAIGYKLAMEISDARFPDNKINLELKGEGEFNYIPEGRQIQWVVREALNDVEATVWALSTSPYSPVASTMLTLLVLRFLGAVLTSAQLRLLLSSLLRKMVLSSSCWALLALRT